MNTGVKYLGLELKNPLIIGASPLTLSVEGIKRCEEAGAGAVVIKSLFEEQIRAENSELSDILAQEGGWHTEVFQYMEADIGMRFGTRDYIEVIRKAKQAVSIPVIASINCISEEIWEDFAKEIEAAGADALELNIAFMPERLNQTSEEIEHLYEKIVAEAKKSVSIPVAVKLAPYFTSIPDTIRKMRVKGADGFVLFNRLYRPSVDIEELNVKTFREDRISVRTELSNSLRWISLLTDRVGGDFAANTGIHTGEDLVRCLLVGARAVQVVSEALHTDLKCVGTMLDFMKDWMKRHSFESIEDFRGRLCQQRNPNETLFGRCQYVKGLIGKED